MRPRRILILVWPEASEYNATLPLARLLRRRGHDVVYAAPVRWEAYLARQGFPTLSVDPPAHLRWPKAGRGGPPAVAAAARKRTEDLRASLAPPTGRRFDLVLLQPTLWQYALALRLLRVPWVLVTGCLGSVRRADVPPVFSRMVPCASRPLVNRIRCLAAWWALRYLGAFAHRYRGIIQPRASGAPARLRDAGVAARHLLRSVAEPISMPVQRRLLRLARREGIEVRWGDYGHRLAGTEIVLGPELADFPRRLPRRRRVYAGACVDTERIEDDFDWSSVDPRKPLVCCAAGSHGGYWNRENRARLVRCVVATLRARPDYEVLFQTTGDDELRALAPLPKNIHASPWFPQLQALSRASLLVTHGGFGTVREALYHGVPMIVFPCGVDQPGNAARVARLGVGLAGDIRTVTRATMAAMLREIEKPRYRDRARRISDALRQEPASSAALRIIEGSAAGGDDAAPTLHAALAWRSRF